MISENKKTLIMGILNVTPDSFYQEKKVNIENELDLEYLQKKFKYADIVDIGAESSRPGAKAISIDDEIDRLNHIISIKKINKLLSIDTYKNEVARFCLDNGFNIINDISGGGVKFENILLAIEYSCPIVLMHMQGLPENMQNKPFYDNVVDDIMNFFEIRISFALKNGLDINNIIIDPGIGFGKTLEHNKEILLNLEKFKELGCKLMIGISRKSFLSVDKDNPKDRLPQSLGLNAMCAYKGADILRVHDVQATYKMLEIINRFKK